MTKSLDMQPIEIYSGPPGTGPNPWKAAIILMELGLPWKFNWIPYRLITEAPYTDLNPNGRLPTMIDPNTNVTLFESGAIVQYLIARYDKEHLISYGEDRLQDRWHLDSWLMLQMSGQGPMFGQKMWFTHFHKKRNVQEAIERYSEQTLRIVNVVNTHLAKRRRELGLGPDDAVWLVGDKCTYADLVFVPWNILLLSMLFPEGGLHEEDYPEYMRWHKNALDRPAMRGYLEMRQKFLDTMENTAAEVLPDRED